MNLEPQMPGRLSLSTYSGAFGIAAALVGGLTMIGWWLDIGIFTSLVTGLPRMAPIEAVALAASGVALWIVRVRRKPQTRRLAAIVASVPVLIGALTLVGYATGRPLAIDQYILPGAGATRLGQPSVAAALILLLVGAAIWGLDFRPRRGPNPAQTFGLLATLIALLALLGYAAGVRTFYGGFANSPGMALHFAVAAALLGAGIVCARPDCGLMSILRARGPDGVVARRLLLVPVLLPLATGLLRQEGQRRGLFDPDFGGWLFSMANIAIFTLGIWYVASVLRRSDAARALAEDELRSAVGRVRDLYDLAPCGYHSVGPDGIVIAMNRTELQWLGRASEEVIGRLRFGDVVSPRSREAYLAGFAHVREYGSIADLELELVRKDGATFPVLVNSTSVRDSDGGYLMSRTTLTDLTERKRAEELSRRLNEELEERVRIRTNELAAANEELRQEVDERTRAEAALRLSEQRYRSFVEASSQVVWITDPNGELDGHSAEWEAYTGQTAAEARGFGWMAAVSPEDRERVAAAWQHAVATRTAYEVEYLLKVRDGTWRHIHARGAPVFEADARIREWVGACIDVTAAREAAAALRQRSEELAQANRDLEQKHAENEMFVYSVSHDLRSPLVNLQGFSKEVEKACRGLAEILSDESVPAAARDRGLGLLDGKVAKSVGFIQSAVMRLSGIIDALLRLSRVGRVEYRLEAVDVAGIVSRVVAAAHGTVTDRGADVRVGELPPAWGDRTAVEQLFGNLVGNALTYLASSRRGMIEVGCLPTGAAGVPEGFRAYYVRDNGLGIPEAHRSKIFQAFQRAHPGVGSGEGLGLAIVARVVERHRGRVWVESALDAGSTFFVTLPVPPTGAKTTRR